MTKRKKSGSGPAAAIGGMLAGFDHQIFRTTPPPHELVLKGPRVRGLSGEGGEGGQLGAGHLGAGQLGALDGLVVSLPDHDVITPPSAGAAADEATGHAIRPGDPEPPGARPSD